LLTNKRYCSLAPRRVENFGLTFGLDWIGRSLLDSIKYYKKSTMLKYLFVHFLVSLAILLLPHLLGVETLVY
jgi:hypothetical protein